MPGGRRLFDRNDDGLTLVEMLVVLTIIAIAAGAVTLGIGAATRAPSVESEARRLATMLQAATDDTLLGDRMIAFTTDRHGYGFATFARDGTMTPIATEALGRHQLPGGIEMKLSVTPPFVIGIDGPPQAMVATIESGSQRWQVLFNGLTATAMPAPGA